MDRVQRVVRAIEPHDSAERYTALGVECIQGEAKITTPWTVAVNGREITTRAIVIAAGAEPFVPPIPGIEAMRPLTSETVWGLRTLPARLLVLGGGPIGCELAQAMARLGSKVTLVEMLPRLLPREDPEFSEMVASGMRADGVDVRTGHKAKQFHADKTLVCENGAVIGFDVLLCALGRVARTKGYGLESSESASASPARWRPTSSCRRRFPTSTPAGTWPGLTSSRTPRRTRRGTRRSTRSSARSKNSAPIIP